MNACHIDQPAWRTLGPVCALPAHFSVSTRLCIASLLTLLLLELYSPNSSVGLLLPSWSKTQA
jgi:hypothetical protein